MIRNTSSPSLMTTHVICISTCFVLRMKHWKPIFKVEEQCGKQVKIVRLDRGGEYYGRYTENGQPPGPFSRFLQEHGIVTQYTMFGSSDQNGVAERRNRALSDMVRSMRSNNYLPHFLWTEALKMEVCIY